ncbi:flagellar P-ring protein [Cellvibrio zantedeschiae]|uniref:Flagellar P-ring protein n=1 Tax=Cellvibrio zantedeschiae TaxID=1237077 RepID=A0ABQ3BDC4_9GAMM|nr:flagellar basal body P-ring protein FlgI [Cellvibrio zantedeschiae]GGY84958.1 flagellar P-ring protein [Cellvibrio zantedeschiae]
MKYKIFFLFIGLLFLDVAHANSVRLKELARVQDVKDESLIGYGIVIGLSGSGDSAKNKMTIQSLKNTLSHFGLSLEDRDIQSRNVAAVMITAKISSFSEIGDQFDIAVSSIGDARSLTGGTLVLTPMYGLDEKIYAFAQGPLTVGGYEYEQDKNSMTKNHPTVGKIVHGATLERTLADTPQGNEINIVLANPDYTTSSKIANAIKVSGLSNSVKSVHPGKIKLIMPEGSDRVDFLSRLEGLEITPDTHGKVVINERSGTIVAGSNVVISAVSIAHGNLKIEVSTKYTASQPNSALVNGDGVQSLLVPNVNLKVSEESGTPVSLPEGTTVANLVVALNRIHLTTRDIITILQSIKTAGALHAELIIE